MHNPAIIQTHLKPLIGSIWFAANRASDMPTFGYRDQSGSEYAIHLSCPWRLLNAEGLLVTGNLDVYLPGFDPDDAFDWASWHREGWEKFEGQNRYDDRMNRYFASTTDGDRTVAIVVSGRCGDVTLRFNNVTELQVHVCGSASAREMWRFFKRGDIESHLVVNGES